MHLNIKNHLKFEYIQNNQINTYFLLIKTKIFHLIRKHIIFFQSQNQKKTSKAIIQFGENGITFYKKGEGTKFSYLIN